MIEIKHLFKRYRKHQAFCMHKKSVLNDVSLTIKEGECVGLIGESGSGKSTLSRVLLGIEPYEQGEIMIDKVPLKQWKKQNKGKIAVVFQDYNASLNGRMTVRQIIQESLESSRYATTVEALLEQVELPVTLIERYPHQLSGGQLQRVAIARAIAMQPRIVVLDEAVSSLDISIQAKVLSLLKKLQSELQLTYLFISHDLQAVAYLCDSVAFLYQGKIVEHVPLGQLLQSKQPYVRQFLGAVNVLELEECQHH